MVEEMLNNQLDVNLSERMDTGVYYVVLINNNSRATKKFIISR
jgi:hypothetical protein